MTKPAARKKATRRTTKPRATKASKPTPPAEASPELQTAAELALAAGREGHGLMDEFEAKCRAVRQWHRETNEHLDFQSALLQDYAAELDEYRRTLEEELADAVEQQAAEQGAIKSLQADVLAERKIVETELAELKNELQSMEVIRSAMAQEMETLEKTRAELSAERSLLTQMRSDLGEEWAGLKTLRQSQTKLGEDLEAERQRLGRKTLKISHSQAA